MKKILFMFFLVLGLFTLSPKTIFASCEYADPTTSSCSTPLGLCIGSNWKKCCTDYNSCNINDPGNVGWVPSVTPTSGTSPTSVPGHCVNQLSGDCTSSSLPQACLVNGTYYNCCNTEQACRNLPGIPVLQANPSQPTRAPTIFASVHGDCGDKGIQTAIGCIHVLDTPEAFLSDILKWAVGIGSGIAFLLILYAGFMIMTASGNPERLKAGQELLTSAISGLILLVLSIFILKFIGIDILGLDEFGFGK